MARYFGLLRGTVLASLWATGAVACPDDQYQGAFGWCYPKIGGTVGQAAEALKHGDVNGFAKAVGDVAITAYCPVCAVIGQTVVSKNDREMISTIVGRGLILQSVGLPTVLLVADAANTVNAIQLKQQSSPVIVAPSPPTRDKKTYKVVTQAACLVVGTDNVTSGGWVSPPTLVDVASGQPSNFPDVDLAEGDVLHITSEPCKEANVTGNSALTVGTITYQYSNIVPGPATRMKFFLNGKKVG